MTIEATVGLRYNGQTPGPTIKVPLHATVRLTLRNGDSALHDWRLVEADEKAPYVAPAFKGARTKIIDAGEQEEIIFKAERPGTFKYVCTVPGHEQAMFGTFIVEGSP